MTRANTRSAGSHGVAIRLSGIVVAFIAATPFFIDHHAVAAESSTSEAVTRLTGTVVDGSGRPVTAASIGIVMSGPVREFMRRKPTAIVSVRTNRAGVFELILPRRLGTAAVVAHATDMAPARTSQIVLNSAAKSLPPLRMTSGLTMRGRIVDEDRRPVADASISATAHESRLSDTAAEAKKRSASSDKSGSFQLTGLEAGNYKLLAQHDGYAARTVPTTQVDASLLNRVVEIELFRGSFLVGRVIDSAGHAIAGATVGSSSGMDLQLKIVCDNKGAFRIGPFARTTGVTLSATAAGFSPRQAFFVVPQADIALVMARNGSLRGQVLDADSGEPLRNFELAFHRRPGELRSSEYPGSRTFQPDEGRFDWPGIFPGSWTITAQAPGYQPLQVPGIFIPQGGSPEPLMLALHKGKELRGRVFDKLTGVPVVAATVGYEDQPLPIYRAMLAVQPRPVQTDARGTFVLQGLPAGQITLHVNAPGYAYMKHQVSVDETALVEIGLVTGVSISGRLLSADGVTPEKGMVYLGDVTTGIGVGIPTGDDGSFVFRQLQPGHYRISAESSQGRAREKEIVVAGNQQISGLIVVLDAGVSIQGTVSGLLPGERGKTQVELRPPNTDGSAVYPDDQGLYAFRGVTPGTVQIVVSTSLGRAMSKSVELSKDNDVTVNFEFAGSARVCGRVTRGGRPVGGIELSAQPLDGQPISGAGATSQSGTYAIEGLVEGSYLIKARGTGRSARVLVTANTVLDFDLPALSITGQVVDAAERQPLVGAAVEIWSAGPQPGGLHLTVTTNYLGKFSLFGLDPGEYSLSAYKTDYEVLDQHVSISASTADLTLPLQPARGAKLRVRDTRTGQPAN